MGVPLRAIAPLVFVVACSQSVAVDNPSTDKGLETPSDGTGDGSEDPEQTTPSPDNEPPIADAGADGSAFVTDIIDLDGSASYDPDGDAIDFEWQFIDVPSGSSAVLLNDTRPDASFQADRPGVYVIELAVSDALTVSTDEVEILVESPNDGPVANAGADQSVDTGDRVVLNGSLSYDPNGDPLDFSWSIVSTPTGSAAVLDDPGSALPQFVADLSGVYIIELTVTDGDETSLPDEVRVTVTDGSDSDCLSCAGAEGEIRRRAQTGDFAGAGLLALLPLLALWAHRKSA